MLANTPSAKSLTTPEELALNAILSDFAGLVDAGEDFPSCLRSFVGNLVKHLGYFPHTKEELFEAMAPVCFRTFVAHTGYMDEQFLGNERAARRAMSCAAVFYTLGWENLPIRARLWLKSLLKCSASPELTPATTELLLNAKIFAGSTVAGLLPIKLNPAPRTNGTPKQLVIDPFITM